MVAQRAAMPQALRYPQTMAARAVRRWARQGVHGDRRAPAPGTGGTNPFWPRRLRIVRDQPTHGRDQDRQTTCGDE
jgi:hypothetical protein